MRIENRVFLVTGGGSGLGAATAKMLVEQGGKVVLADINAEAGAAKAAELGAQARFVRADIASEADGRQAVATALEAFGGLHGLANCAGVAPAEKVLGRNGIHALESFRRVIDINLVGSFNMLRLAAEAMSQGQPDEGGERGVIVNTASVAAFDGQIGQAAYSASKSGVVGMTLPIARELARFGIRVMTIAPGIFETPMMAGMPRRCATPRRQRAVPAAPGASGRIRRAGPADHREQHAQRRSDSPRRRHPHGRPLIQEEDSMTREDPIVIVSAVRTPMGGFLGDFKDVNAATLGAAAVRAAVERARLQADEVDEAVLGCVLAAGQGQAPARQAVLGAGLARGTPCSTLNKMCGSGMKALMLAHDTLLAGSAGVALAGGMESMSNAPYLLERARSGYRMGHGKVLDHMFLDGLEDAYDKGRLMGTFAEDCAEAYGFTREAQDEFAVASLTRAQQAMRDGRFQAEIVPLTVTAGKTERLVDSDEQPPKARLDKIPTLKPAFREGGTVTAANSSSISDGAAALVLMRLSEAERRGLAPLAAIRGHASFADAPNLFPTAPVGAVKRLMQRTGWSLGEVDLFEVNEAFAVVGMAAMRDLDLSHEHLNVHGGACALGHPIGASGARIVVTLLNALQQYDLERGVAAVCIGGGEATAIAVERLR